MSSLGRLEMLNVLIDDINQSNLVQTKTVIVYIQNQSVAV